MLRKLLILASLGFIQIYGLDHGEDCNLANDLCDKSLFLQCSTATLACECWDYQNTYYDSSDPIGCKRLVNATCDPINPTGQSCVRNSHCHPLTSRCTCDAEFQENNFRKCYLNHGASCETSPQNCDPDGFLECFPQPGDPIGPTPTCRCRHGPNLSWYNEVTRTCHITPNGMQCDVFQGSMPCVPNAECDDVDRRCKCASGMDESPIGLCFLGPNQQCNPLDDLCNHYSYLKCDSDEQSCLCTPTNESLYDTSISTCHLLANATCYAGVGGQPCIPNSQCLPSSGPEPYRCTCSYNLVANKNRKCFLDFGKPCDRLQSYCDPEGYLICSANNTCACADPNGWYDISMKECRLGLNSPCSVTPDGLKCCANAWCDGGICKCTLGYEEGSGPGAGTDPICLKTWGQQCSSNEECNHLNFLECRDPTCQCIPGFLQSQGGNYSVSCLPGFGASCSAVDCAPEAKLRCVGGACDCLSEMVFNPAKDRCVSLLGGPCDAEDSDACTLNAHCQHVGSGGNWTCTCDLGYQQETFGDACTNGALWVLADWGLMTNSVILMLIKYLL